MATAHCHYANHGSTDIVAGKCSPDGADDQNTRSLDKHYSDALPLAIERRHCHHTAGAEFKFLNQNRS